ncbi:MULTISPECIES: hypothetical protein [unclassified Frankia]|uniref:hypothetical protein n=1 Tax=unclassified Frankia TaxID=2632575 RepID=UPI002AD1FC6D|nr:MULTISPECIES: hypothetical protein [unclassified Frankia]
MIDDTEGGETAAVTVRLVMELTPVTTDRIDGRIRFDDERIAEFHGWMDLIRVLEEVIAIHSPPPADG